VQPEKSAVAEHSINLGHRIKLQDTTVLCTKATCVDRMIREAIGIDMNTKMAFVSTGHGNLLSTLSEDVGSIGYSISSP
jgi:hypothetical protein